MHVPLLEPSYEPLFEMPDYKKIGCIIKNLNHSYYFDDESYETGIEDNVLLEAGSYELSLPALSMHIVLYRLHGTD